MGHAETDRAARLILASNYVIALAGSGISAESGVPTFRGPGGMWTRLGEPSVRGYQQFLEDPRAWWLHQIDRDADPGRTAFRDAIDRARPNPAHKALAELERLGILQLTITQNVDGLHHKAGSVRVVEIHGSRYKLRCIDCESRWPRDRFEIPEYPPHCPECDGLVKGDTVMFGEPVPPGVLERCYEETDRSDCMIAVGTSATVYPAANLPRRVIADGGAVIEINTGRTPLTDHADVALRGPAGEVLPRVVERVRHHVGEIQTRPLAVPRHQSTEGMPDRMSSNGH